MSLLRRTDVLVQTFKENGGTLGERMRTFYPRLALRTPLRVTKVYAEMGAAAAVSLVHQSRPPPAAE